MVPLLAQIGRRGTEISVAAVVAGLFLPDVAAVFRPWLAPMVAVILTLTLLLVEPAALARSVRRPSALLAAIVMMSLVTPALVTLVAARHGEALGPGLVLGLYVFAFAPPTAGAAAYAAMMRLDPAPSLALQLALTLAAPLSVPALAGGLFGVDLPIDPAALALRLALIVAPAVAVAALVRRLAGPERVRKARESVVGLLILPLVVFALGSMDGILPRVLAEPGHMLAVLALAFAVALGAIAAATAALWPLGRGPALALGYSAGNRNLGLIVGALSGVVPADTWAYFALAQFPIYALPFLMRPLYRRLTPG